MKVKSDVKFGTEVMSCSCKSEFQDGRYGHGRRVFNRTKKLFGSIYRCTVCEGIRTK